MTTHSINQKAFIYDAAGLGKMLWSTDFPYPSPSTKEGKDLVLIKVISAGLNPIDYKLPTMKPLFYTRKGTPVGQDLCGVVERVGSGVVGINVGDKVFGFGPGLAEYTLTSPDAIALLPEGVPTDVAGGLGVAPNTAYQMLADNGAFEGSEPKQIVVIGAAGGVGSCAVQIARAKCPKGTKIYGICSGKNAGFVKSLGADEVIDYTKSGFNLKTCLPAKSIDVVADCVSSKEDHNYVPEGMGLLKEVSGRYVAINSASTFDWIKLFVLRFTGLNLFKKQYSLMMCVPKREDLTDIGNLVNNGKLKIHVESYIPFDETSVRGAFETLKNRHVKGKLIVKVSS